MAATVQQQSVLELELDRLRNSLAHLERSNRELREALQEGGPDPDFKEAIQDNIVTIAKQRARVAAIEEELQKLTGRAPTGLGVGGTAAATVGSEGMEPERVSVVDPEPPATASLARADAMHADSSVPTAVERNELEVQQREAAVATAAAQGVPMEGLEGGGVGGASNAAHGVHAGLQGDAEMWEGATGEPADGTTGQQGVWL